MDGTCYEMATGFQMSIVIICPRALGQKSSQLVRIVQSSYRGICDRVPKGLSCRLRFAVPEIRGMQRCHSAIAVTDKILVFGGGLPLSNEVWHLSVCCDLWSSSS